MCAGYKDLLHVVPVMPCFGGVKAGAALKLGHKSLSKLCCCMRLFPNDSSRSTAARWWVLLLLMLAVAVVLAVGPLRPLLRSAAPAVFEPDWGHLQGSSVVENSGKVSLIRLLESQDDNDQIVYRSVVSDVATGQKLAEPQVFTLSRHSPNDRPQMRYFSDGNLYLTLRSRMLLRYDPGAMRFVDITPQLVQRFEAQLGAGVSKVQLKYRDWHDALDVYGADGQRWAVHWLAGEIWPYQGENQQYYQQVQTYTHTQRFYRYLPVLDKRAGELLVQYEAKAEPGKALFSFDVELIPVTATEPLPKSVASGNIVEGGQYWVRPYRVQDLGLVKVWPVQPQERRFHAEVLGENSQRVLLAYSSSPVKEEGRVLQLLDKSSQQIVWSRPASQIPALAADRNGGSYVVATALTQGFFINLYGSEPALLIDNNGAVLKDFAENTGSKGR